jgi:hypothetical protein
MSQGILKKLEGLTPLFDRDRINALQTQAASLSEHQLENAKITMPNGDHLLILESSDQPRAVLEWVFRGSKDSVAALYHPHPIFNTRGEYLLVREELIGLIHDYTDAGVLGKMTTCSIRREHVHVRHLLLDQLVTIAKELTARFAGTSVAH